MRERDDHPARHFSVLEIRRAIAHHRRAIEALHDQTTFQGIHLGTAKRLVVSLEEDLRKLEDELGRRRMGLHRSPELQRSVQTGVRDPLQPDGQNRTDSNRFIST